MAWHCWPSVDAHFARGISALYNQLILHCISFTLFWQPFLCFLFLFPWSLHCSLIIHTNKFLKIYFTVSTNSTWSKLTTPLFARDPARSGSYFFIANSIFQFYSKQVKYSVKLNITNRRIRYKNEEYNAMWFVKETKKECFGSPKQADPNTCDQIQEI